MRGIMGDFTTFIKRVGIVIAILILIGGGFAKPIFNQVISDVDQGLGLHISQIP